jgi:hypothetical protein
MSTYNFLCAALVEQLKQQNTTLKSELEFLQKQNMKLLEIIDKINK